MKDSTLAFGVGLTRLSLCFSLTNALDVLQQFKQQPPNERSEGAQCLSGKIVNGEISETCFSSAATVDLRCSSACDSLYSAYVSCYGAESARMYYAVVCRNGYQGRPSSSAGFQPTFSYTLLLVAIAVAMKIVG